MKMDCLQWRWYDGDVFRIIIFRDFMTFEIYYSWLLLPSSVVKKIDTDSYQ